MTVPCCYSDVNGTACTCRARKAAETERDIVAREWSEVSQWNYQRAKEAEARLEQAAKAWRAYQDAWTAQHRWDSIDALEAALATSPAPSGCQQPPLTTAQLAQGADAQQLARALRDLRVLVGQIEGASTAETELTGYTLYKIDRVLRQLTGAA